MQIDILTLFPEMFVSPFNESIIKRAREKGLINLSIINIRDFAQDKHLKVDDYPYGGGAGMVMKADVVGRALAARRTAEAKIIYMSPRGQPLKQSRIRELAGLSHMILLCGHYEGIDERVLQEVDEEISIGDYILTGGELPAMVLADAVIRLIPGVLGGELSSQEESFAGDLLEYPHYTRPPFYKEQGVPEILRSGHHEQIRLWRKKQSLLMTLLNRPDLLLGKDYDEEEREMLLEIFFCGEKLS